MRRTALFSLLLPALALAGPPMESGPLSTAQSIPISIQNEIDVAIENGRVFLDAHQGADGLWDVGAGERSSLPAFAYLEPPEFGMEPCEPLRRAVAAALERLAGRVPFVQTRESLRTMAEDALVVAAALSVYDAAQVVPERADARVLSAVRSRLAAANPDGETSAAAWLRRTVLDLVPGLPEDETDWKPLFLDAAKGDAPTARDVAIAGYARVRCGRGADSRGALMAHLRWLREHGAETPEDLYYQAVFLDSVPAGLVREAGFSGAWRTETAQRLISTARSKDGGFCWGGEDAVRQTLFAVATLITL